MNRLELAVEQIVSARRYTVALLAEIDERDWFRMPAEGVSHIAWQVGHLAMAEYRLALDRIRGYRTDDEQLISGDFLNLFGRDSVPSADPSHYPAPAEIRRVFDRVHQQVQYELLTVPDADLDLPPHKPHRLYSTRFHSLVWCCQHEMLHAGQIGLLRRLLGAKPVW